MGPPAAAEALRKALSMGGDRAVHVSDPSLHGADAHASSLVLAKALERLGYDIVVCGMASTDAGMGAVPSMLAERLGIPQLTLASRLTLDGDRVTIERETQLATETVEGVLPALVSVTDRTGDARYPSFKGIMAAKKKKVETWSLADLGIDPSLVGLDAAYTKVLSATARPPREGGEVVTDDDGDGASNLAAFLSAQKFI
jgi:electron transfer flavoprotein beta subunit